MEVLLVGQVSDPCTGITPILDGVAFPLKAQVLHLGVLLLYPQLLLGNQVAAVATLAYCQLMLKCQLWLFLEKKALVMVIHAFVTSRPDYCYALALKMTWKQLLVQNAESQLLMGVK